MALKEGYSKTQGTYQTDESALGLNQGGYQTPDDYLNAGNAQSTRIGNLFSNLNPFGRSKSAIDVGSELTGKGIKYEWGENDPNPGGKGMDCSHFTNYATNQSRKEEGKLPIPYNTMESLMTTKDYKQIDPSSMKKGDQFVWRYDYTYTDKDSGERKTTQGGQLLFLMREVGIRRYCILILVMDKDFQTIILMIQIGEKHILNIQI